MQVFGVIVALLLPMPVLALHWPACGRSATARGTLMQAPTPPITHCTHPHTCAGHEPEGVYSVPHFDFHAYLIPQVRRDCRRAPTHVLYDTGAG